ncbi:hypothetical protein HK100_003849 [Physocladia obscura]|uniref:Uncharacterized protein n=1 Tax=Physocladia obscura TaxID=109957 RepID=A0AAD5X949_9FUNG|nr:hypothetical protein HK100_003849 [Physocladia obscura]
MSATTNEEYWKKLTINSKQPLFDKFLDDMKGLLGTVLLVSTELHIWWSRYALSVRAIWGEKRYQQKLIGIRSLLLNSVPDRMPLDAKVWFDEQQKQAKSIQLEADISRTEAIHRERLRIHAAEKHVSRTEHHLLGQGENGCGELFEDDEDSDYVQRLYTSSPSQSESTSSTTFEHSSDVTLKLEGFFHDRDTSADTLLRSGFIVEKQLEIIALHEGFPERPEHSCILNLDDPFCMEFFRPTHNQESLQTQNPKDELRQVWNSLRTSYNCFSDPKVFDFNTDYTACQKQLDEIEAVSIFCAVAKLGKDIKLCLELWLERDVVRTEADLFRQIWEKIFSVRPSVIVTTSPETTMRASKFRKLNTQDKKNIRGLQSDLSWEIGGITLCWAEGKKGDWVSNHLQANSAFLKAAKGSKDCIDYIQTHYSHNVEVFFSTLLENEFKLFSSVKLASGMIMAGLVFSHRLPRDFHGMRILVQIYRDLLKFMVRKRLK